MSNMKIMTEEEALSKCKIYDGKTEIPEGKTTIGNYESNFVSMAQTQDGVERINEMVRAFKKSPAAKAMSVAGDAYEPIVAILWDRYKYWDGGGYEQDYAKWESDLAEDFVKMIAKDYN